MALMQKHQCILFLSQLTYLLEWCNFAIHTEGSIRDNEFESSILALLKLGL